VEQGVAPSQTQAALPAMGLAGQHQQIHLVNHFIGDDPHNETAFSVLQVIML
jgi:hypothetical protein